MSVFLELCFCHVTNDLDFCYMRFSSIFKDKKARDFLASQLSLDCRARRSGWVGFTRLISSAFIALLNCLFYFFKGWDNGTSDQNRCNNFDK